MLYRYETHLHCVQCSNCARSASTEYVYAYHKAGYAGMILTDHFVLGSTCVREEEDITWEAKMHCYYAAYLAAKAVGDTLDFDVIFGIEHAIGRTEVLCYGIDLDFLLQNPDLAELSWEDFAKRVHAYGGILVQAHPYRGNMDNPDAVLPENVIDGIEVYNAANQPIQNQLAWEAAQKRNGIICAGGDVHRLTASNFSKAGITLPYRIRTGNELVDALRRGDHGFYVKGQNRDSITLADLEG